MSCSTTKVILGHNLSICHLWESKPHRGDSLWLNAKLANPTRLPWTSFPFNELCVMYDIVWFLDNGFVLCALESFSTKIKHSEYLIRSGILGIEFASVIAYQQWVIYLFGVLRSLSTHCIGHIRTGSFMGRGNQYIQLVDVLYCKLLTNGKQLLAFPLEVRPGFQLRPQRWEARVLPFCHHSSHISSKETWAK